MQLLNKIFIVEIDYTIKISELIYYWIISIGLLWVAYKTYRNSIKKEVLLAAQLKYDIENFNDSNIQLEIYNYGNYIAKNIYIESKNVDLINNKNSLLNNDIGFIRPGDYKKIHIGYIFGGEVSFLGCEINKEEFFKDNIVIGIRYNNNRYNEVKLNTQFLNNIESVKLDESNPVEEISKSLKSIDLKLKLIDSKTRNKQ